MTAMLEVERLEKSFGGVRAVDGFSFHVDRGETLGIIGPNGAGKTTVFNLITRFYTPDSGRIRFMGKLITHLPPYRLARLGIARTFQNLRLFKDLTVFENVLIAKHCHIKAGLFGATFRLNKAEERAMALDAEALLERVGLLESRNEKSSSLPYGKQRRLEIARALATGPRLLLLDEPAAGMNPKETDELSQFIVDIKDSFELTVFLIEHHMNLVMDISDSIYVLDYGKTIAYGTPAEVQNNDRVIQAYLGVEEA